MADKVRYRSRGGVATIEIDNPPVNALSADVRKGLTAALEKAWGDAEVKAIVLAADGRTWPAGADINEFGKPPVDPSLPEVCAAIEASAKPVIAALHGTALGGGLELALAARIRLAAAGTKLGLPEVTLGILPGAGGTQRLPRLIGAEAALKMMLGGQPILADKAERLGVVDAVVPEDVTDAAERLAIAVAGGTAPIPGPDDRKKPNSESDWLDAVASARAATANRHLPAPRMIVDCVEAALLLPEAEGHAFERAAFGELLATPQSQALRHAFLAERRAARQSGLAGATPRPIAQIGVVGGGLMGTGITLALLAAGYRVTLVEQSTDALAAGLGRIAATHDRAVQGGKLTPDAREDEWDRVSGTTELAELETSDLIIEAIAEDEAKKVELFKALGRIAAPRAILATNTSYLDVNRLAEASGRPGQFIGIHFFSPAQVMKLVEVVPCATTETDVVATAFMLARRMGKNAVRAGVCEGFIGNRLLTAYRTACDFLLEDGTSPYQIDRVMTEYGFPMGPYQVLDLAGLDISWSRRKRLAQSRDPGARYVSIGDLLCEQGRLGRKSGRGYYRYPDGGGVQEDPEVLALIQSERHRKGIVARSVTDEEIRLRALTAMANEGARILEEGLARCPSDIDVVMLAGFAYPRWRGGPMLSADQAGLLALRDRLRDYAREDSAFWRPARIWDELIKNGRTFADLNNAVS